MVEPPVFPSFSDFCRRKILARHSQDNRRPQGRLVPSHQNSPHSLGSVWQGKGRAGTPRPPSSNKLKEQQQLVRPGKLPGDFPQSPSCLGIPLFLPSLWDPHFGSGSDPALLPTAVGTITSLPLQSSPITVWARIIQSEAWNGLSSSRA